LEVPSSGLLSLEMPEFVHCPKINLQVISSIKFHNYSKKGASVPFPNPSLDQTTLEYCHRSVVVHICDT
jgi:hypothetical protein